MDETHAKRQVFKKMDFLIEPRGSGINIQDMTDEDFKQIEEDAEQTNFLYI